MLLFMANYPDSASLTEGMSQRIVAMDEQLKTHKRAYLWVSHRLFGKREVIEIKKGVTQYRCNFFVHFFFIIRLLKQADTLYVHSVLNVLPWLPMLPFIRKKTKVVLDAHGVVPEETFLLGTQFKGRLYSLSEKCVIRRADVVITVTKAMEEHFRHKYRKALPVYQQYAILPSHILNDRFSDFEISDEIVYVIYSGNTQIWQNIGLMLSIIKKNRSDRIKYDILTGEPEVMKAHLRAAGLERDQRITVANVSPQELKTYYRRAHYGFILRDDITVNRVACPTKLIEYLHYGIIPIVKSSEIGDFKALGYEYIDYQSMSTSIPAKKSARNNEIVKGLLTQAQHLNFKELVSD